jgi:hypothetical protein
VLASAVLVSNALAYHVASIAPKERLDELERVEELGRDYPPLLYTEFEEFAKHFLRDAQPVGASEAFAVPGLSPTLRGGDRPRFGLPADLEELKGSELERFGSIVVRRSPEPLPPTPDFELAWRGRWYDLFRRRDGVSVSRRGCGRAAVAPDGRLPRFEPARSRLPAGWARRTDPPSQIQTVGPGVVSGALEVTAGGRFEVWLSGSFGRAVAVRIDGRDVGEVEDQLSTPYGWVLVGAVRLEEGDHRVEIEREGGDLEPGNGDGNRALGPLVLRRCE